MATELATTQADAPVTIDVGFHSHAGFELLQRMAKLLAASQLVPKEFQGNIANTVIALEMAKRMNASPLAVMQNLYIVHGKPSWSSTFIIAAVNSTEKFSPLRFRLTGTEGKDDRTCVAWAVEKATGETLESPPISIGMAKAEGWFQRNGSKWQTMPELMLRYRCATLFGRLYAPEVLMGMTTVEEAIDITPPEPAAPTPGNGSRSDALTERLKETSKEAETAETKAAETAAHNEGGNGQTAAVEAERKETGDPLIDRANELLTTHPQGEAIYKRICGEALLQEVKPSIVQKLIAELEKPMQAERKATAPKGQQELV